MMRAYRASCSACRVQREWRVGCRRRRGEEVAAGCSRERRWQAAPQPAARRGQRPPPSGPTARRARRHPRGRCRGRCPQQLTLLHAGLHHRRVAVCARQQPRRALIEVCGLLHVPAAAGLRGGGWRAGTAALITSGASLQWMCTSSRPDAPEPVGHVVVAARRRRHARPPPLPLRGLQGDDGAALLLGLSPCRCRPKGCAGGSLAAAPAGRGDRGACSGAHGCPHRAHQLVETSRNCRSARLGWRSTHACGMLSAGGGGQAAAKQWCSLALADEQQLQGGVGQESIHSRGRAGDVL